jgi:membrane-associated PAP2 superfamily phosphatase
MANSRISSRNNKINFLIFVDLVLIILALCLINYTEIDIKIQDYFFDFENKSWLVDRNEPVKKFIFYQFPKILLGLAIFVLLASTIFAFVKKLENRRKFLLILLGLVFIPLIAGNIKKFTNVYCPNQLQIYGGKFPYVKIFDSYPSNLIQEKRAQCFPAGHAVTGFALLILFFALEKKRNRFFGLFSGIALGWILGSYQMLKGVHFFGDTLVSMLLCFLVAALLARFYRLNHDKNHKKINTRAVSGV